MNSEKAKILANRPYFTVVMRDYTTSGNYCYLAYHPELKYCMSHGNTSAEALANLAEARLLFIEDLLDSGLSVPEPQPLFTETAIRPPFNSVDVDQESDSVRPYSPTISDLQLA